MTMTNAEWISVQDQIPDDDREVLVVSDGRVLIANYLDGWIKYVEDEDNNLIPRDIEVDYWMELPEPPEDEG